MLADKLQHAIAHKEVFGHRAPLPGLLTAEWEKLRQALVATSEEQRCLFPGLYAAGRQKNLENPDNWPYFLVWQMYILHSIEAAVSRSPLAACASCSALQRQAPRLAVWRRPGGLLIGSPT